MVDLDTSVKLNERRFRAYQIFHGSDWHFSRITYFDIEVRLNPHLGKNEAIHQVTSGLTCTEATDFAKHRYKIRTEARKASINQYIYLRNKYEYLLG